MSYNGKVVWITGASSGIGEALAYALAATGAKLVLSARNEKRLDEVRLGCPSPDSHLVLPLDLERSGDFDSCARTVLDRYGQIDVLVNNGGISQRSLAADTNMETVRRIMEPDFFGAVALTRAVLPAMFRQNSGHVVVVSSLMGKFSTPLRSAYAAAKHALHGFFNSLRAEVRDRGIKVTIVCPGFIRTGISINALCADGSCHGIMDEAQAAGMSPSGCAERIIQAMGKGKDEVLVGGKEVIGVYLNRFVPGLFNRIIARAKVT